MLSACTSVEPVPVTNTVPSNEPGTRTPFVLATAVADSATATPLLVHETPTPDATPTPTLEPSRTPTRSVYDAPTPSPTATPSCFGALSGTVYDDANLTRGVDAGEFGLGGAVIELRNASGVLIAFYTTGNGQFTFPGLGAGDYSVHVVPPPNYVTSADPYAFVKIECFANITQNFLTHSVLSPTATPTKSTANLMPNDEPQFGSVYPSGLTYFVSQCMNITAPGTYRLTTSLTSKWDCIQIYSDWVVFDCQGHSLDGLDYTGYGLIVHQIGFPFSRAPQNIEIRNCKSARHKYGIYVDAGVNVYIHHNQIVGNFNDVNERGFGQFLGLPEGGGIRANGLYNARIEENVSNYNAIGIDIRSSVNTYVRRNVTSNNTAWGVHFYDVHNSEISFNTAKDNVRYCAWGNGTVGAGCDAGGIMLQGGSNWNVVKNNQILSGNGNGIFIKAHDQPCGDNNTIAFNHISNVMYNGVELSFCKDNKMIENEIDHALDGIWLGFASGTRIEGGNNLHDINNHGFISWNSRDNSISDNAFVNDREGIYLYSSDYRKDEFFFVPGEPADHVSRGNYFGGNTLVDNSVAAVHLSNAIHNEVRNNRLHNNARNFLFDGNTTGNIIENNTIVGGAYLFGVRHLAVPLPLARPRFLQLLEDMNGESFTPARWLDALTLLPSDSSDLRWFKIKLRISLLGN